MAAEGQSPEVPQTEIPVLNFLKQKYVPADAEDATLRLTTLEIAEEIAAHTGTMPDVAGTYTWLEKWGYHYDIVSGMRFEWLLKETDTFDIMLQVGDKVEVLDKGLLSLMRFAPPGARPLNHGTVAQLLEDGEVLVEFPIGNDDPKEHSQVAPYAKHLVRKRL